MWVFFGDGGTWKSSPERAKQVNHNKTMHIFIINSLQWMDGCMEQESNLNTKVDDEDERREERLNWINNSGKTKGPIKLKKRRMEELGLFGLSFHPSLSLTLIHFNFIRFTCSQKHNGTKRFSKCSNWLPMGEHKGNRRSSGPCFLITFLLVFFPWTQDWLLTWGSLEAEKWFQVEHLEKETF